MAHGQKGINVSELKKNYTDILTSVVLDWLPPMRIIIFKSGKECISDWIENKDVKSTLSYCPKAKHYMFYYKMNKRNDRK